MHKSAHEDEVFISKANHEPKQDRPGTTQRVPKIDFTNFESDKDFSRLLARYPLLRTQLQAVYGLTLQPGPDETRTWNRGALPGFTAPRRGFDAGRGRARGRSARGQRGSRGGRGGHEHMPDDRQHGPWTQEKGDKEALAVVKKMREGDGSSEDEAAEGMREFVELCQIKFVSAADVSS